tara:strand:+ start:576 stop:710 length:135 start_codon:yes stop_codon:yes gene_type:complete
MKAKIENTIILFMGFSSIILGCVALFAIGSALVNLGAYIDTLLF